MFREWGSPDLPACGVRRGSSGGLVQPSFIISSSRPSRGAKPRGADDRSFLRSSLIRRARKGAERSRQGTSRGARDASHDDRDQAGARHCSVLVSSLVQKGQAQAQSTEASSKGFHIGAMRPRPEGPQDVGHHGAQDDVTTRTFGR